jgi:hypothetical protein
VNVQQPGLIPDGRKHTGKKGGVPIMVIVARPAMLVNVKRIVDLLHI